MKNVADFRVGFSLKWKRSRDAEAAEKAALDRGEFDRQSKDQVRRHCVSQASFLHKYVLVHVQVLYDIFDLPQRIKELEERVRTMADVIAGLERRLKELSKGDASLPATLARIRAANEGVWTENTEF